MSLTDTQRQQVEHALRQLEAIVAATLEHDPLANLILPAVDEIRKALDLDSD